jgi:hypothetical protein
VKGFLPKDAVRLGIQTTLTQYITQAIIDIQSKVPKYRTGHETIYLAEDFVAEGNASKGRLPQGAMLTGGWFIKVDEEDEEEECIKIPLTNYPWNNRSNIICGDSCFNGPRGWISVDPQRAQFLVVPAVEDPNKVSLFWDGLKTEFEDDEAVPFDERCAMAVADFVRSRLARIVDKDLAAYASFNQSYLTTLRGIFVDATK